MFETLSLITIVGLIATAAMTMFLYLVHISGTANADMIRAVGGLFTSSHASSLRVGVLIHTISGVVFAFLYFAVWSSLGLHDFWFMGPLLGFGQGIVVSIGLMQVSEHHPIAKFRNASMGVAFTHLLAHVVYGSTLAFGASYLETNRQVLTSMASLWQ